MEENTVCVWLFIFSISDCLAHDSRATDDYKGDHARFPKRFTTSRSWTDDEYKLAPYSFYRTEMVDLINNIVLCRKDDVNILK